MLPAVADWRDGAAYAPLETAGRHGFAWEWLRRMPAYRAAWQAASREQAGQHDASRFGLHRFEPAEKGVPHARPIWRAGVDPGVVRANPYPRAAGDGDAFDICRLASLARCHCGADGSEHWLFSDGLRQIRLDIAAGTLTAGPVRLAYRISGLASARPQIATLQRLIALSREGRMTPALFPLERRAKRWVLILRIWDALAAGMSQRDIACELFDLGDVPRWRITAPSWRRRVQRLVAAARRAAKTDPRAWLTGTFP